METPPTWQEDAPEVPGAALATASLLAQLAGRGELVGLGLNIGSTFQRTLWNCAQLPTPCSRCSTYLVRGGAGARVRVRVGVRARVRVRVTIS